MAYTVVITVVARNAYINTGKNVALTINTRRQLASMLDQITEVVVVVDVVLLCIFLILIRDSLRKNI